MKDILRAILRPARAAWRVRRFQAAIVAAEMRQRSQRTNRLFDEPFDACWCADHCAHSGGLHSYLESYRQVLEAVRPAKVLEWGPGPNTDMACGSGATVVTIEQDERWLPEPREEVTALHIDVDDPAYLDPGHWDADLFFADSRRRSECIRSVHRNALKRDHVLCLHDAQRRRYHAALMTYRYVRFLSKGTAVASDSERILAIPRCLPAATNGQDPDSRSS